MLIKSIRFSRRISMMSVCAAGFLIASGGFSRAYAVDVFKTTKNGTKITCGLVSGKWIPGAGSSTKFVSTAASIKSLAKKTDAKSKAKLKKLKAYLKLANVVCRLGPPNALPTPTPGSGGGSAAAGQQVFTAKCANCHTKANLAGKTAASLQNFPGMPSLTSQEAADLAAYVNS